MNRSFPLRRAASARPHPVFPCRVLLGAVLLAFGGLAPVQADDGLVVVGYGGAGQKAQEVAFFQPFTQQTGIPVVQSEYNGEMARIKVMADTGHADWDLVQVEGPDLARGCDDGLFERLDWQAIGGKQQLIANAAQECGSAALVWGVAIGYDADRLQQPPASWADFWDVQRFPGKRGLRKRAIYNLSSPCSPTACHASRSIRCWRPAPAPTVPSPSWASSSPTSSGGRRERSRRSGWPPATW